MTEFAREGPAPLFRDAQLLGRITQKEGKKSPAENGWLHAFSRRIVLRDDSASKYRSIFVKPSATFSSTIAEFTRLPCNPTNVEPQLLGSVEQKNKKETGALDKPAAELRSFELDNKRRSNCQANDRKSKAGVRFRATVLVIERKPV